LPQLFSITLFVSAALLFCVQPLIAKMILPLLGGSPAVWNTCMVFFQALLLAGYAYAHATTAWLGVRRQAVLHLGLLLLPVATLPLLTLPLHVAPEETRTIAFPPPQWVVESLGTPPAEANPIPWLLALLLLSVGLPFFLLATSAPLLQKWFANTGHPAAGDPYFLYAASNLGSMLALLGYPLLLEPTLPLLYQAWFWATGYGLLVVLTVSCAAVMWRSSGFRVQGSGFRSAPLARSASEESLSLTPIRRLRWVALAFVPSSLLLGVTTYITTDIASLPLLWVVPLALYLLTFILVFARKPIVPHSLMVAVMPLLIVVLVFTMLPIFKPTLIGIPLHLATFFVVAMVCHGELAQDRPPPAHLTEFYLWLSVGGVLGGLLNALVAPLLFNGVAEYPLALVLACLLRPGEANAKHDAPNRWLDGVLPLGLAALLAGLILGLRALPASETIGILLLGSFLIGLLCCYSFKARPLRLALGIAAILLASDLYEHVSNRFLYRKRSFFGVMRIRDNPEGNFRELVHGNTIHGRQSLDPDQRGEALTYFHRTGPAGQIVAAFAEPVPRPREVTVIGLGAGSLASYGQEGEHWTFYEIDPAVVALACDLGYFTFWRDSPARLDYILGDARIQLRQARDGQYGLLVIDAFSSDSIPLHLINKQALRLYLRKLADNGILAFHISNRHLDLKPVLANLARDADLMCLSRDDLNVSDDEKRLGKLQSQWIVMARHEAALGSLAKNREQWQPLPGQPGAAVWTDDFSNITKVIKWKR
jgi:hypothetical protein